MKDIRLNPAMLAVIAVCLALAPCLRADQSADDATAILTAGKWYFVGRKITRTFKPDGTYTSSNVSTGTWQITDGAVEIMLGTRKYQFPLPINPDGTPGVDSNGKEALLIRSDAKEAQATPDDQPTPDPASLFGRRMGQADRSTPAPPAAPTATPVPQLTAAQVIQTYRNSLVFVTGSAGSGSGFIATISGANFLVTNVHVAAGIRDAAFKTLDGAPVQGGAASMAVGEDIFCMALPAAGKPFEVMKNVDQNAAVGDDVVVLGNAEGAGVVNPIAGTIVGIGPNLLEIDAPFVPGNSGSPIVHLKSGKVIGVATYLITNQFDLSTDTKLKQPVVRRFGFRLDSVKGWQPVDWRSFDAQAARMEEIEGMTRDLYNFFREMDENKGRVTPGFHTSPLIKERIDDWLAAKSHNPSVEDAQEADANFISFLKIACESDIAAAQRQISYDYFQHNLADQKRIRDAMAKALQEIIRNMGQ